MVPRLALPTAAGVISFRGSVAGAWAGQRLLALVVSAVMVLATAVAELVVIPASATAAPAPGTTLHRLRLQ